MYYVTYYKGKESFPASFEDKNKAIRYFNHLCDRLFIQSVDADRIEICNESVVLFDYEV